jgi:hypothetical protein
VPARLLFERHAFILYVGLERGLAMKTECAAWTWPRWRWINSSVDFTATLLEIYGFNNKKRSSTL